MDDSWNTVGLIYASTLVKGRSYLEYAFRQGQLRMLTAPFNGPCKGADAKGEFAFRL